ncbi:hypothetical protein ABPG72_020463 [Tetrahymena utriculariae]
MNDSRNSTSNKFTACSEANSKPPDNCVTIRKKCIRRTSSSNSSAKIVVKLVPNSSQAEGIFLSKSNCLILAAFKGRLNITEALKDEFAMSGYQKVLIVNTFKDEDTKTLGHSSAGTSNVVIVYKPRNTNRIEQVILTEPNEEFLLE